MSQPRRQQIAFFIADRTSGSSRLRVLQFIDRLEAHGIVADVCATRPSKYLPRPSWLPRLRPFAIAYGIFGMAAIIVQRLWQVLRAVPRADVVFVQKDLLFRSRLFFIEWLLFFLARRTRTRIVLDIDDAIHLGSSRRQLSHMSAKVQYLAASATTVFAGSPALVADLSAFAGDVRLMPTCLTAGSSPRRAYVERATPLRAVWTGAPGNARDLRLVAEALERIYDVSGCELEIVTRLRDVQLDGLARVPLRLTEWSEAREAAALARADVALAPLADTAWGRRKCGARVLAYFRAALPVVASPVGLQRELVIHGVTGMVAESPSDWWDRLVVLQEGPELRARLGTAGRTVLEARYSAERQFDVWLAALVLLGRRRA